ncbi:hypothetical protein V8C34DRAFT_98365 [Trichoderma compactum]
MIFVDQGMARILDVTTGACLQSFAHGSGGMLQLVSIDPTNARILTFKYTFYNTSSWEHWRMSPRHDHSYDFCLGVPLIQWGAWILRDGKRNCYVPSNFRPGVSKLPVSDHNVAMTGSLLAILNELEELVIIKLPTRPGAGQQAIETFDVSPNYLDIVDELGNPRLVARLLLTSDFGLKNHKEKEKHI